MQVSTSPSVLVHFSDLVVPRVARTKLHPLLSVVAIALCGVICGADSWVEVEEFGKSRRDWLAGWLDLSAGIPSHDTFGRVFAALDPVGFEACFAGWVQAVRTTVIDDPALLTWLNPDDAWDGMRAVARGVAERRSGGEHSRETRYYLTSLPTARLVHDAVRSHWGIENSVHWVLDMAFREDLSRVRVGHGAHNFSLLRRLSLNLLRQDHTAHCGIKGRRLKAALSPAYLLATLHSSF